MKKANKDFYSKHKTILLLSSIVLFIALLVALFFVLPSHKQTISTALQQVRTGETAKNEAAEFMTAMTFKHLSIYPFICQQNGYTMKNYQKAFIDTFSSELEKYNKYLSQNNLTEIKAWDRLPEDYVRNIFFSVDSEIQSLTDAMNKQSSSQGTNSTAKDACAAIDNGATSLFAEKLKPQIKDKISSL